MANVYVRIGLVLLAGVIAVGTGIALIMSVN